MTDSHQPQPARATRARASRPSSVLELEIPPSGASPRTLVVSAVVPVNPKEGEPSLPGFTIEGIAADVQPLSRDAKGAPRTVVVSASVDLSGRAPGSFARLKLEPTGEAYQPSIPRDVPELDLAVVIQTPDGFFTARPFADADRGERQLGRFRSTWRSFALVENRARDTRGIVIASVEARDDGLAVVEILIANGLQLYSESQAHGGDFCYSQVSIRSTSAIVIPLARAGETVTREGDVWVANLVTDGKAHLWPRMQGALRRIVLAPPNASPELLARADEVGSFYGSAFAIEGPNSWAECGSHGPERGFLAPWTDSLDVWGKRGPAGARELLGGQIGQLWTQRVNGLAGGPFQIGKRGIFHPLGQFQEGEPGGWKIRPVGSFALDRRLLVQRWIEIEHGLDRSRDLHFELRTGKPTTAHSWAARFGGRVPFTWRNGGDGRFPWMRFERVNGQLVRESNVTQGRMVVHQDGDLLTYEGSQDDQHEIRDVEPVETVARFTGSGVALSILELLAANGELARHEYQSPAGDVTMRKLLASSSAKPGVGSTNAGRGLAWDLRSIVAFWEFAPDSWRAQRKEWARTVARWAIAARSANGLLGNDDAGGHTSRVAISEASAPAGFRYVQTFEEAYLEQSLEQLAALAMPGSVPDAEIQTVLRGIGTAVDALWDARFPASNLVPKFVAVGLDSGPELADLDRAKASTSAESTWIWGLLAVGARCALRLREAPVFQERLSRLLVAGRGPTKPAASFEAFVREAQALEREPWHGSADYSALAWGEAWRARTVAP